MSYWDTSALVKLSVAEADSAQFQQLAGSATRIVTASIARLEARTVFRRREAEGALPAGEAAALSAAMDRDVANGRVVIQATDADVEREFTKVLEMCFSQIRPFSSARTTRCTSPRPSSLVSRNSSRPTSGSARRPP